MSGDSKKINEPGPGMFFTIGISVTHIKIAVKNTNFKFKFFISKLSKKLLQAQGFGHFFFFFF